MAHWRRRSGCETARQWLSASLDGELSEFERAALDRHLAVCESCRTTSVHWATIADAIRNEPLAEPTGLVAIPSSRSRLAPFARRGSMAMVFGAAAAAAAALAVALALPQGGKLPDGVVDFTSPAQQQRFALEHVRTEPQVFLANGVPFFAERALG